MTTPLATFVYALGILGLLYLNRDRSSRTSRALWIPVIWFWIIGSRAVSQWLGIGVASPEASVMTEGSPTDALVFQILLAAGLAVIARRIHTSTSLMASNWPIVCYFLYCLMSVMWSDFPDVSLKRWIKATGDVIMALVVVTDAQPVAALRRIFSRVGFILIPSSILLIKYYPTVGHVYDQWTGQQMNTGVTTNKNMLGVTAYILALGALWQVLRLWRESAVPNRTRQLVAQSMLLGLSIWTLFTANSATSESCFMLAAFLMLVMALRRMIRRPSAVHTLILTVALVGGLIKITGADAAVYHALGRKTDLTGRATEIWPLLIRMAPNAVVGAGFESFWLGPRLQTVWEAFPNLYVIEAHNGYIELYLNLGAIGIGFMILLLVRGYRSCVDAFRIDPNTGALLLAYLLSAAIYSYTEAGFRMLDFTWSFLVLSIIAASAISRTGQRVAQLITAPSESVQWYGSQIIQP
jgi:exopolysaccharide production protein ExoQ